MVQRGARLRDRSVLVAQITALRAEMERGGRRREVSAEVRCGALDALDWVTHGGPGPLTGALAAVPVALALVVAELAAAEDIIFGQPSRQRDYAYGVEQALMWAQFASATPPAVASARCGGLEAPAAARHGRAR